MHDVHVKGVQYFVIIAEQDKKKKLLALLNDHGARGIETIYAHGSMSPSAIAAAFGFETKQVKVMISCLLSKEKARKVIDILYKDFKFDKPNTGIAFSIDVEGLSF